MGRAVNVMCLLLAAFIISLSFGSYIFPPPVFSQEINSEDEDSFTEHEVENKVIPVSNPIKTNEATNNVIQEETPPQDPLAPSDDSPLNYTNKPKINKHSPNRAQKNIKNWGYKVKAKLPHDRNSFTQGLEVIGDYFYEGTGLYGESKILKVEKATGNIVKSYTIDRRFFGEGITVWNNKIYQITWKEHKGFVYDLETFDLLQEFSIDTEGWGLTHDDQNLILSDGSSTIYFIDPETFETVSTINVKDGKSLISNINELEYINGEIWANLWYTHKIARINPKNGEVKSWINLFGLLHAEERQGREDVLNGIAYDSESDTVYVTGKLWPKIFEIELVEQRK